ncbi:hypothetical protein ACGFOM_01255 [Streptomyces sp. NPDC048594]
MLNHATDTPAHGPEHLAPIADRPSRAPAAANADANTTPKTRPEALPC